jgi:hypothetical protein
MSKLISRLLFASFSVIWIGLATVANFAQPVYSRPVASPTPFLQKIIIQPEQPSTGYSNPSPTPFINDTRQRYDNEVPFYIVGQKISVGKAVVSILGIQKGLKSFSDKYIPAKGNILVAVNIEFETKDGGSATEAFQSTQITGKNGIYFPISAGVKKPTIDDLPATSQKIQFWQTFEIPNKETNLIYLYQTVDFKLISFSLSSRSNGKTSKPPIVWDKENEPIVISRAEILVKKVAPKKDKIVKKPVKKTEVSPKVAIVQPKPLPTKLIAKERQTTKTQIVETLAEEPIAVAPSNGIYRIRQRIPSGNFILSLTDWEMKKSSYIETYQVPSGKFMVALKLRVECLDEKICDSLSLFYFAHLNGRIGSYSSSEYGQKLPNLLRKAVSRTIKRGDSIWYERVGWLTFEVSETDSNFVFAYRDSKEFKILLNDPNEPIESNKPILSTTSNSVSNAVPRSTNANVMVSPNTNANIKIISPDANTKSPIFPPANIARPVKTPKGKTPAIIKVIPQPTVEKPAETPKTDIPPTSSKTTPSEKVEDSNIQLAKNESGKIIVSGVVPSQQIKDEITASLVEIFGDSIDTTNLIVNANANDISWLGKFYKLIPTIVGVAWRVGSLYISAKEQRCEGFPESFKSKMEALFAITTILKLPLSNEKNIPTLPKLGKTASIPIVSGQIFKARYKDWENETIKGTLEFDDDYKQLVFRDKNAKVTHQFNYSDIKLANPSLNSNRSTTGSVVSGIPLPGISILGENLRKKSFYLTIGFFVNNDSSNLEIKIFQLESLESTNAIVKMINERIKPNPK